MSKQKLFGATPEHKIIPDGSNYTGAYGEITIDLALPGLRIHDGNCCGGIIQIVGEPTECALKAATASAKTAATATTETAAPAAPVLTVKSVGE